MINESLESMARKIRQPEQKTLSQLAIDILPKKDTVNALKLSYISGLALGATGRFSGAEWISAVPPIVDILTGTFRYLDGEKMGCYIAYGLGIATAYADKIYSAMNISDKL